MNPKLFQPAGLLLFLCAALLGGLFIYFATPVDAQVGQPPGVFNVIKTVTSGTPIQLTTAHVVIDSMVIEMLKGGTGIGYVCAGIPGGTTPSSKCSGTASNATFGTTSQLGAQLASATSTAPGGSYSYPLPVPGLDASTFWVDGDSTSDTILISVHVK
jgi:hypothetical protein